MMMKLESLLAVVLIATPVLSRATDVNPATLTPTPTGTSSPSASPSAQKPSTSASDARAAVASASPIPALNAAIDQMMVAYNKTEDCLKTEASLRADLAQKKAQLSAEFKGAIPIAFDDLLWQKTSRINRWHQACVQNYDDLGRLFDSLALSFRTVEPKNTNIKKQTDFVAAQKTKYLAMRATAKAYNKPAKPAAAE